MSDSEQIIHDANKAQQLLDEPVLKEAIEGLRKDVYEQLERLPITGSEREKVRLTDYLQVIRVFEDNIKQTVQSGKIAKANLKERSFLNRGGI